MQYTWNFASVNDTAEIMNLNLKIQHEVDTLFNFNPNVLAHNIVLGLVNQHYTAGSELLAVARDADNKIIAFTWAKANESTIFSAEPLIYIRLAHVDPDLPVRTKIKLLKDQLTIWERFAQLTNTPLIYSSTLREEQATFLRLHQQSGYTTRGSSAYKRVDLSTKPSSLF